MFSKALILLILSCSLASIQARRIDELSDVTVQRSIIGKAFKSIYHTTKATITHTFDKAVQGFETVYDKLVTAGKNVTGYGQQKVEDLKNKYHDIVSKPKKIMKDMEAKVLAKIIKHVTKVINDALDSEDPNEIKDIEEKVLDAAKKVVDKVGKEVQDTVAQEVEKVKEKLENWKEVVDDYLNGNEPGKDVKNANGKKSTPPKKQ